MINHTPGPWKVVHSMSDKNEKMLSIQRDCGQKDEPELSICGIYNVTERQTIDARLIAAAPDLLAALEKIAAADTGEGGCFYTNRANIHIARSAISFMKAK